MFHTVGYLSMVTRVGCCSRDTAVTVHQTASSVASPEPASSAPASGLRDTGAVTSLLGASGVVAVEITTLHTPGRAHVLCVKVYNDKQIVTYLQEL